MSCAYYNERPAGDVATVIRITSEVCHDPIVEHTRSGVETYPQNSGACGLFAFVADAHGVKDGSRDDGHRGNTENDVEP